MSECKFCGKVIEWRQYVNRDGKTKSAPFEPKQVEACNLAPDDWLLTEDGRWMKIYADKLNSEQYNGVFGSIRHNCKERE